ncbi:CAP domain-containing protein [Clostridium sp. MB40-C1]|uniref:CAP domain-containing protein n=1 Tax=Clostridium sp. MB40-C1 TaxID=3070996 RepID=UPI0027E1B2AB|nr:CAP domain-containing protein [Clostridium sp. MB40-C1]WMJ82154.1 CAP domain-containing protein [Clostridium sp. MB40-C1]
MKNKRFKKFLFSTIFLFLTGSINALGQETFNYVVKSGDSLWKICVKYEVGVSDVLALNPNITNPNMIYPNTTIKIPNLTEVKKLENEVIRLVNVERSKVGLGQLKANWQLSRVARYKSQDMINKKYFSHTSPTYGSPFDMMRNFGINYRSAGENIAYGQNSPSEVMKSWMNSPGHKQNILNSTYTEIGVGVAKSSNGQLYWTQMFIRR